MLRKLSYPLGIHYFWDQCWSQNQVYIFSSKESSFICSHYFHKENFAYEMLLLSAKNSVFSSDLGRLLYENWEILDFKLFNLWQVIYSMRMSVRMCPHMNYAAVLTQRKTDVSERMGYRHSICLQFFKSNISFSKITRWLWRVVMWSWKNVQLF